MRKGPEERERVNLPKQYGSVFKILEIEPPRLPTALASVRSQSAMPIC